MQGKKNGNIDRQKFPLINSIVREEESASLNVVFSRICNATHNQYKLCVYILHLREREREN